MPVGIFNITSNDTLIIDGNVITTGVDKKTTEITLPNNLATGTVGKNGNGIIAANKKGQMADMKLRVLLGNVDDVYLLGRLNQWVANPTAFVPLTGSFVKNLGDALGNIRHASYILNGGYFLKNIPLSEDVEGDTEQAVAMYELQFLSAQRVND